MKDFVDNKVIHRASPLGEKQGISIMCEINNIDVKHKEIKYYEGLYCNKTKEYFKFTIIKNPDRILSYYFWNKGKKNNSFQYKYISNDFYIVHFENIINELKQIYVFKDKCNFDNYPQLNSSINSKIDYNTIYDKEIKDLVYNKFKKYFYLFGYNYYINYI